MTSGAAPIPDIECFLRRIKLEMRTLNRFSFVTRKANMDCLANLGVTVAVAQDEIMSLTYQDYDRGPLPDHSREGEVWEFVKDIGGIAVYIKLKLDPGRGCVCLSFHESSGPVALPYQRDAQPGRGD